MSRRLWLPVGVLAFTAALSGAEDKNAALFKEIQAVAKSNTIASPAARAAWERLVAAGPGVLPELLQAMNNSDTVVANWLATAFDRIVQADRQQGGKGINADLLAAFVKEPTNQGRVRRLTLELLDELRPGTAPSSFPAGSTTPSFATRPSRDWPREQTTWLPRGSQTRPGRPIRRRLLPPAKCPNSRCWPDASKSRVLR